jgi:hypothetical protein
MSNMPKQKETQSIDSVTPTRVEEPSMAASGENSSGSQIDLSVSGILYRLGRSCEGARMLDECKGMIAQALLLNDRTEPGELLSQLTWCKAALESLTTYAKEAALHYRSR